jgi:hypothetical protein
VSSFALAGSLTHAAHAQAGEAPSAPDGRGFVEVAVAANDDDTAALVEALRELVGRLGLGLHAMRADAPPWANGASSTDRDERARVFIDNRFADRIEITASAVKDGVPSAPVRRAVARAESTSIVVEQVAHAVHATLESLLSGGADAATLPEANAPPTVVPVAIAPAPVPGADASQPRPIHRRSGFGLDAAAFASGRGMASNVGPVIGAGGAVNLTAWPGPWRPRLWIGGSYNAAFGTADTADGVTLGTAVTSIRAVPSIEVLEHSVLQVDIGAGGGVDVFHAVPGSLGPSAAGQSVTLESRTVSDPVLSGQLVARIRLVSSARLLVGFDVDYDLDRRPYTVQHSLGSPTAVLEPWPVRPSAMIGLCVPLVGNVACSGPE